MYQPTQNISLKRTNSFSFVCQYTDEQDQPLTLVGATIKADIKDGKKELIAAMVVTPIDLSQGVFELTLPADTDLPLRTLYTDVRITTAKKKRNSDTLRLDMSEVVTDG